LNLRQAAHEFCAVALRIYQEVCDTGVTQKLLSGTLSRDAARELLVIWHGEAKTNIVKEGDKYHDANVTAIGY